MEDQEKTAGAQIGSAPSAPVIKPTVGRVVYYKTKASADGSVEACDTAAIITKVYSDTEISIVTFWEFGSSFKSHVTQGQEQGQWDWMPFQKDQQARLAK